MTSVRVFIRGGVLPVPGEQRGPSRGRWEEIPNGPFPITPAQLQAAREKFAAEVATCPPMQGVRAAPQTTARAMLREIAPHLSGFDTLILAWAVTAREARCE